MKWISAEPKRGTNAYALVIGGIAWLVLSQLLNSPKAEYFQAIFILGGVGFLFAGIAEFLPTTQKQFISIMRIVALISMFGCFIVSIWLVLLF